MLYAAVNNGLNEPAGHFPDQLIIYRPNLSDNNDWLELAIRHRSRPGCVEREWLFLCVECQEINNLIGIYCQRMTETLQLIVGRAGQ